jgi:hypothetical protein
VRLCDGAARIVAADVSPGAAADEELLWLARAVEAAALAAAAMVAAATTSGAAAAAAVAVDAAPSKRERRGDCDGGGIGLPLDGRRQLSATQPICGGGGHGGGGAGGQPLGSWQPTAAVEGGAELATKWVDALEFYASRVHHPLRRVW